ncbi:MAG: ribonuclease III, partial [Staphylococcus sp.]|nr:ribonuclease III [Staphylococcus sp.]
MTNHKKTEMINRFREQFAQKMHELGFEYNN